MVIWIDVEDASGVRYGDGPIVTASEWQSVRRLDAAGTFSFTMPASDPRCNLLQHKRIVRCWGSDGAGVRDLGAGIVDQIEVMPSTDGRPAMLRVSGDDLLRELANRTVGALDLFEAVDYPTTAAVDPAILRFQSYTAGNDLTLPAAVDLSPYVDDNSRETFLYVQHPRTFNKISLTLTALNSTLTDTFQLQYYNAQEPGKPTWETVGGLVNNSAAPHPEDPASDWIIPFGIAGETTIEFDPPLGWSPLDGLYIIRMFDQVADLTSFTVSAASVTVVEPVSDGLARIMALAPAGWSLDPAGEYATAAPVYMQFAGESVLSALVMLAEQTGEHFVKSPAARRVWWLGNSQADSGLRAVQGSEPTDTTMLITALSRTSDSYELYTRLYAYGGGVGDGRLTIATAGNALLPAGWVRDPEGLWLENTNASATYGRIDRREDYPDIAPVDASVTQVAHAAGMLLERMRNALLRKSQLQYAYRLDVAPGPYAVWPGQTLRVTYHEWVDGYHAVNIDADLVVLEISERVSSAGVRVAGMTVATVDYTPANDYSAVARMMGSVRQERSTSLPASDFTSNRAGVPVALNIKNGQIAGIRRVNAVEDRWHNVQNISQIKTTNGIITAVIMGSSSGGSGSSGGSVFPPRPIPWPWPT